MWRFILKLFLTLSVFISLLSLACWQFERAVTKKALLREAATQAANAPVSLNTLSLATLKTLPAFAKITVSGTFDPNMSFLLDNQVLEQKLGVLVITLFHFKDGQGQAQTLLVDRGFLSDQGQRTPPAFATPKQPVQLQGHVFIPTHNPFIPSSMLFEKKYSPWRIQSIRIADIAHELDTPLLPFVFTLAKDEPGGFLISPKPISVISPARHLGYALTWLSLALAWLILLGWFYHHKRATHAK